MEPLNLKVLYKIPNGSQKKRVRINSQSIRRNLLITMSMVAIVYSCGQPKKTDKDRHSSANEALGETPDIPIQAAIISGNLDIVRKHIEAGTDLNEKDTFSGSTPLITAASFGKDSIAQALIDAGADLTAKNTGGSTALHTAAFFCRVEIVQMLLNANADKTTLNNEGFTARETITVPFQDIKPIYEMFQQQLAPMGLELDLVEIEKTRPLIAEILQ